MTSATAAMKNNAKKKQQEGPTPDLQGLVISELENDRYQWRTIEGIANDLKLPRTQVRRIIEEMGDKIVRSSIPDDEGRSLYTTRQHYRKKHGFGDRLLNALTDRVA